MSEVVLCNATASDAESSEPRVVMELSHPALRFGEWRERYLNYQAAGVEEYYLIYPGPPMDVEVWCREGDRLAPVRKLNGWISPRIGLRFAIVDGELTVFDREGKPLRTPAEMVAERDRAE